MVVRRVWYWLWWGRVVQFCIFFSCGGEYRKLLDGVGGVGTYSMVMDGVVVVGAVW